MRFFARIGWALIPAAFLAPLLPLWGEETVTVPNKPLPLAETRNPFGPGKNREEPWLGVSISKPSTAIYAQLPKVPRGAGFVVDRVAAEGPAELAGVEQNDFLWKLDDQLLINESQFMALLDLRAVGDVVRLTYLRGGESHEVEATLVDRPESEKGMHRADEAVLSPLIPGLPTLEVLHMQQTAVLRDGSGTVRIQRMGERYNWVVFDEFGLEMTSGQLVGGEDEDFPPEMQDRLKGKLKALIRSLEGAEQRRDRGPRVRRVPSPNEGKSQ